MFWFIRESYMPVVKGVVFVSDRISYIILRGHWCHVIFLNVSGTTKDKIDYVYYCLYEEQDLAFDKLPTKSVKAL
jgi:hypothetical protein